MPDAHEKPPWDPSMSDGCSVPRLFRVFAPLEDAANLEVCLEHDRAYYYGGTRRERAIADAKMLLGHLERGMDVDEAHRRHAVVRMVGKAHFGDGRYTDDPSAEPAVEVSAEAP
jgi:hypothetical protein